MGGCCGCQGFPFMFEASGRGMGPTQPPTCIDAMILGMQGGYGPPTRRTIPLAAAGGPGCPAADHVKVPADQQLAGILAREEAVEGAGVFSGKPPIKG